MAPDDLVDKDVEHLVRGRVLVERESLGPPREAVDEDEQLVRVVQLVYDRGVVRLARSLQLSLVVLAEYRVDVENVISPHIARMITIAQRACLSGLDAGELGERAGGAPHDVRPDVAACAYPPCTLTEDGQNTLDSQMSCAVVVCPEEGAAQRGWHNNEPARASGCGTIPLNAVE